MQSFPPKYDQSRQVVRLSAALDPFPYSQAQKQKIIKLLLDMVGSQYMQKDFTESAGYLSFYPKAMRVVEHFAPYGLTSEDYFNVLLKKPQLLYQSPDTLISNVENAVQRFASAGVDTETYLHAAMKHPQLFFQSPATLERKIDDVVKQFAGAGLSREKYIHAAMKQPQILSLSSDTVAAHVNTMVETFAADGLTTSSFITSALKAPSIFCLRPDRMIANITSVVDAFAHEGLTTKMYLEAAEKLPQLWYLSPEAITRKIDYYLKLYDDGVLRLPEPGHKGVITYLMKTPFFLGLSEDNIKTKQSAALLKNQSLNSTYLFAPKRRITAALENYVNTLDHPLRDLTPTEQGTAPPDVVIQASSVEYGEMILVDLAKRQALGADLSAKVLSKVGGVTR